MQRLFITLILLSMSSAGQAAEVKNLYQAAAPVSSRDVDERARMTPQLLRQVMLKVVGNQSLLDAAPLEPVLENAEQYLQQYEYQRTNIAAADLTRPDQLSLRLSFEPSAVNQAINDLQLPLWGKVRPDVLVWAVVEAEGQQSLVGLETDGKGVLKPLTDAADTRGLPILLPLMDLQDQSALTAQDIREMNQAAINQASMRYGADIVLAADIKLLNGEAIIQWQANGDNIEHQWQSQGSLGRALQAGMGQLADKMALKYSPLADNSSPAQRLKLQITNVLDYADFNRLMNYLRQLDLITDIRVENLGSQQLDLDIAFRGSETILQRTLTVGSLLAEDNSFSSSDAKQYRLIP
ncbi:DUF2066 domain-containing protein [uncultured Methylophaga sp.]|uniref:DUF2066 domain-containing protein n=1 Tax=uncultured Methylophaga sp. TaxID=285271 RepID=UPI00263158AB|nr:DUF2066 domain-containing protein [uncultured Methylophaga sp.]